MQRTVYAANIEAAQALKECIVLQHDVRDCRTPSTPKTMQHNHAMRL